MNENADAPQMNNAVFPPNLTGTLAENREEAIESHDWLLDKIKGLESVEACCDLYDSFRYQECLRLLRGAQNDYIQSKPPTQSAIEAREEWAQRWAEELHRNSDWAWALNRCRKTALKLLYRVCDLSFPRKRTSLLTEVFDMRRIRVILVHCLVMDRANSLYNMTIELNGERGLGWYAEVEQQKYALEFRVPLNPDGPTTKRMWMPGSASVIALIAMYRATV